MGRFARCLTHPAHGKQAANGAALVVIHLDRQLASMSLTLGLRRPSRTCGVTRVCQPWFIHPEKVSLAGLWHVRRVACASVGVAGGYLRGVCPPLPTTAPHQGWSWWPSQGSWQSLRAWPSCAGIVFLGLPSEGKLGGSGGLPTDSLTQTIELKVPFEALEIVSDVCPGLGPADFSLPIVKPSSVV